MQANINIFANIDIFYYIIKLSFELPMKLTG